MVSTWLWFKIRYHGYRFWPSWGLGHLNTLHNGVGLFNIGCV